MVKKKKKNYNDILKKFDISARTYFKWKKFTPEAPFASMSYEKMLKWALPFVENGKIKSYIVDKWKAKINSSDDVVIDADFDLEKTTTYASAVENLRKDIAFMRSNANYALSKKDFGSYDKWQSRLRIATEQLRKLEKDFGKISLEAGEALEKSEVYFTLKTIANDISSALYTLPNKIYEKMRETGDDGDLKNVVKLEVEKIISILKRNEYFEKSLKDGS